MTKEQLEMTKEQKVVWQSVTKELQEMSKVNINTLLAEKVFSSLEDNQSNMWCRSINWKVTNIGRGLVDYEKLLEACEQVRMKILEEIITIVSGEPTGKDFQHIDCQVLVNMFIDRINSEISNRVSDAETVKKLSFVSVTLGDCDISAYQQELTEIQDKYFTAKLRMDNVFIPSYEPMAEILGAYRAFKNKSSCSQG